MSDAVVSPTPAPARVLRDAAAAQTRLHAQNHEFLGQVDRTAFNGNGDAHYWMNRTQLMAFQSLAFAARSTLGIAEQCEDAAGVQAANCARVVSAKQDATATAQRYSEGYGDANYWFNNSKNMSIVTAGSAANIAALCDHTLAAAVGPQIERALKTGEEAHYGNGDAKYWSQRTADEAASVRSSLGKLAPAVTAPPTAGQESALQKDLEQINRNLTRDVESLVFNYSGQAQEWMYRSEYVAVRSCMHMARKSIRLAREQQFDAPTRDKNVQQIARLASDFRDGCEDSANGNGNAQFWLGRAVYLGRRTAAFVEGVATLCDRPLMDQLQPLLERAMQTAENGAFEGSGYAQYWADRVWDTTTDLKIMAEDACVRARAEQAAQEVPTGTQTAERHAAEMELSRQDQRLEGWQKQLAVGNAAINACQTRMGTAAAAFNPLAQRDQKILPWLRASGWACLGSAIASVVAINTHVPVLAMATMTTLAASGGAYLLLGTKHRRIVEEYKPLRQQYDQAERAMQRHQRTVGYVKPLVDDAELRVGSLRGDLDLHKMAEAVNKTEQPPPETVTVEPNVVRIGNLIVPRRQDEADVASGRTS